MFITREGEIKGSEQQSHTSILSVWGQKISRSGRKVCNAFKITLWKKEDFRCINKEKGIGLYCPGRSRKKCTAPSFQNAQLLVFNLICVLKRNVNHITVPTKQLKNHASFDNFIFELILLDLGWLRIWQRICKVPMDSFWTTLYYFANSFITGSYLWILWQHSFDLCCHFWFTP